MAAPGKLAAVVILFAIIATIEVRYTIDSLDENLHVTERARIPFNLKTPGGTLSPTINGKLPAETTAAGFKIGDFLDQIDGRPVHGLAAITAITNAHHPGDAIQVSVTRNGVPFSAPIKLGPDSDKPLTAREWTLEAFLYYLTPWFCILLGFTVAFLRPDDMLAWLLLLLMVSFSGVAGSGVVSTAAGWGPIMRTPAVFVQSLSTGSWGVWMMLFGQYFPDRRSTSFWNKLARWALGLPLLLLGILVAFLNAVEIENSTALQSWQTALSRLGPVLLGMLMTAIATFFINISIKSSFAKTADDKRRLRLLYWGTTLSLTPIFLIIIAALVFRKNVNGNTWIVFPALFALFLFPLTMAYVIVVEKAMDLKVVIRQGLQYALARRGLRILSILFGMGVFISAMVLVNEPTRSPAQKMTIIAVLVVVMVRLRVLAERLRKWIDRRFFREAVDTERVLRELGEKVRTIVEVQPLLATVTSTISSALHVPRIAVMMRQNGFYTPAHALGYASPPMLEFAASSAVAARLEQAREPLRVSHKRPEPWVDKNIESLGTELLLPVAVKDRLLGFLSLGPKLSEEPYTPTDVALLETVASQTGLALENSRLTEAVASEVAQRERLNRELEIAREVQQRLFPQAGPEVAGLDYAGKCRPASSVGGDYYDFVSMCDGRLGIAIGDISGKGVPAALLMASLQASLRGLAIANPPALSALMVNLNRLIFDASPSNRYATFFYGVYDPVSREFRYVNGGHNPPMVFRGDQVLRLEEGGPVVGLFGPAQYSQAAVQLELGDTLVLFTDGVSEAMNNADEEFDEERLMAAVRSGAKFSSLELIDHVMQACDVFADGAPQHDDMTLVVVRVKQAL